MLSNNGQLPYQGLSLLTKDANEAGFEDVH